MSEKYKLYEGGVFFVTLTTVSWIDVFTRSEYCDEIINNLNYCINNKGLEVYCYCIMPSHIHIIASTKIGTLGDILRDFKSFTSKKIIKMISESQTENHKEWLLYMFEYFGKRQKHNQKYQFWKQSNHPIDLLSNHFIDQKIDYIHGNPVKARIVDEPENYVYSSAYEFNELLMESV
ncbi:MAG: transposase [Bacteroidetes bacterium]|nr:transposase [Bacteroidia bacterium]PCH66623.1 MAG: transposase [Bacteroidota bacterium]